MVRVARHPLTETCGDVVAGVARSQATLGHRHVAVACYGKPVGSRYGERSSAKEALGVRWEALSHTGGDLGLGHLAVQVSTAKIPPEPKRWAEVQESISH